MNLPPAEASRCLLSVRRLRVHLRPLRHSPWPGNAPVRAVEFFDLDLMQGETLVVAGESGSGKSVLARTLAGLEKPLSGSIRMEGRELLDGVTQTRADWRALAQLVPQQPFVGVSARMTVGAIIERHLKQTLPKMSADQRRARVAAVLPQAGLTAPDIERRARDLQPIDAFRVAVARALATQPRVLVCDAPGATLELAERKLVLELLLRVRRENNLALLLTAQDARPWRGAVHRAVVMYLGRVMEQGSPQAVLGTPAHPYTRALLESEVQVATSRRGVRHAELRVPGEAPNPAHPPLGCVYHPRCEMADAACVREKPPLRRTGSSPQHYAACLFAPTARPQKLK